MACPGIQSTSIWWTTLVRELISQAGATGRPEKEIAHASSIALVSLDRIGLDGLINRRSMQLSCQWTSIIMWSMQVDNFLDVGCCLRNEVYTVQLPMTLWNTIIFVVLITMPYQSLQEGNLNWNQLLGFVILTCDISITTNKTSKLC